MKDESSNSANTSSCFYGLCIRQPCSTACGKYSCGLFKYNYKFKNPVHRTVFCLMILIVVCLLFAVIVPMVLYSITDTVINYEVVIDSESAPNYDLWHTNAYGTGKEHAKIQMDLYFFDLQNPEEVAYNRSKPRLVERGPYAYDEYYLRFDIEWTDHGDTVSYYLQKYYIFNQERTGPGLQENDMILMPYPTVVGFKYILDEIPPEVNEYFDQSIEANLTAIERNLIGDLNNLYDEIIASEGRLPTPVRDDLVNELRITNQSVVALFDYLDSFLDQSSVPLVLFKTLMCNVPSGLSPFWRATPSMAWFGWLRDPILYEVQKLIDVVTSFNRTANATIPWTSSVPGPTVNWTSTAVSRSISF